MNDPFKLYVSKIFDLEGKGVFGLETRLDRINKNLHIIFNPEDLVILDEAIKKNAEGVNLLHRFCQFIVYLFMGSNPASGTLAFFDCKNNIDIALDIHLQFGKSEFGTLVKEDFMKQFLEIEKEYEQFKDLAVLTTEDYPENNN